MASKIQIAEQVKRILDGGDATESSQYDIREISLLVGQFTAAKIKENLIAGLSFIDRGISSKYIRTFRNIEVKKDSESNEYYADIPGNYILLPNDKGVFLVAPMIRGAISFIPVKTGFGSLYECSDAKNLEGKTGYYVEGDKLYFDETFNSDCGKIQMKLVVASPEDLSDDENLPIGDEDVPLIIKGVLSLVGHMREPDKVNDNNEER